MALRVYSHHDFGGWDSSIGLFTQYGYAKAYAPEDADIIVFNGGADIGTEIYNETPVMRGIPHVMSQRDLGEIALFNDFKGKKFMLGICRGAQLLNCLNGGKLWQHVNHHTSGEHTIYDLITDKTYKATSTHHQMMRPNTHDGKVIAVAGLSTIKHAAGVVYNPDPKDMDDVEIVWYPSTHTLCIQGHPEYVPGSEFADYCIDLVNKYYEESFKSAA